MVAKKDESSTQAPDQGPIQYETPWKMLAVFAVLFLGLVVYGFLN
jgi:hypothetical protein